MLLAQKKSVTVFSPKPSSEGCLGHGAEICPQAKKSKNLKHIKESSYSGYQQWDARIEDNVFDLINISNATGWLLKTTAIKYWVENIHVMFIWPGTELCWAAILIWASVL